MNKKDISPPLKLHHYLVVEDDALQWIQIDMQNSTLLTGVTTQGRPTMKEEWVETFKIMYGETEDNLQYMRFSNGTDIVSKVYRQGFLLIT